MIWAALNAGGTAFHCSAWNLRGIGQGGSRWGKKHVPFNGCVLPSGHKGDDLTQKGHHKSGLIRMQQSELSVP